MTKNSAQYIKDIIMKITSSAVFIYSQTASTLTEFNSASTLTGVQCMREQ